MKNKIAKIDHFYVTQFAYFLEKLQSMKDPSGASVLDNSMVVYGSGLSDGNRHRHDDHRGRRYRCAVPQRGPVRSGCGFVGRRHRRRTLPLVGDPGRCVTTITPTARGGGDITPRDRSGVPGKLPKNLARRGLKALTAT